MRIVYREYRDLSLWLPLTCVLRRLFMRARARVCTGINCVFVCMYLCHVRTYTYDVISVCVSDTVDRRSVVAFDVALCVYSWFILFSTLCFIFFSSFWYCRSLFFFCTITVTTFRLWTVDGEIAEIMLAYRWVYLYFSFLFYFVYNAVSMWRMLKITIHIFILLF